MNASGTSAAAGLLLGCSVHEVVDPAKCGHRLGHAASEYSIGRAVVRLKQVSRTARAGKLLITSETSAPLSERLAHLLPGRGHQALCIQYRAKR